MNRELKKLVTAAKRASRKTRCGYYPMAPSIGLTDREIARHDPALEANAIAAKALREAGLVEEAKYHERMRDTHSWVVNRVGRY